mgnify:CR=1 FL=1
MSPHGVLIVDKPSGPTSHDVVARARRVLKTRAVGHAGTLDPMASGVLLVLVGEATKLSSWLTLASKRYQTRIRLGVASDTLDAQGTLREVPYTQPSEGQLRAALAAEKQRASQVPPSVSAIKVDGRRAYELTRKGEAPELSPREVSVQELELLSTTERELELRLTVSKGYYVRALARDLAQRLDTCGYLCELRRLASGPFGIAEAVAWSPEEPGATGGPLAANASMAPVSPPPRPHIQKPRAGLNRRSPGTTGSDSWRWGAPKANFSAW